MKTPINLPSLPKKYTFATSTGENIEIEWEAEFHCRDNELLQPEPTKGNYCFIFTVNGMKWPVFPYSDGQFTFEEAAEKVKLALTGFDGTGRTPLQIYWQHQLSRHPAEVHPITTPL